MQYPDSLFRDVFLRTKRIAIVGASIDPSRPSHYVGQYLADRGYDVVPVNPRYAGQTLFGTEILGSLTDLKEAVDMVDIFRRSEAVPQVVDTALTALSGLRTAWMQIGVHHAEAAARAEAQGITVIQNRCPKIEYQRLFGARNIHEVTAH